MKLVGSSVDIRDFASRWVLGTLEERYAGRIFSRDIWSVMGEAGLLGMTVSKEYGGSGATGSRLAVALQEFTASGCDLGLALSWITHLALCAKSIEKFGSFEQKNKYLHRLVSGEWVGAMAVSEPGSGAHPGKLKTIAKRDDDCYKLTGTKVYITDAPVADLFVVLAVTGDLPGGRKEITAFLVEAGLPGLSMESLGLDFLKTSPHGIIRMDGVRVGSESILARVGDGHSAVSREAFSRERSAVACALYGIFKSLSAEVSRRCRQKSDGFKLEGVKRIEWIHHLSALEAYRMISQELTDHAFIDKEQWKESVELLIYLGISYAKWGSWIEGFVADEKIEPTFPLNVMMNDMKLALVGEGLWLKEGSKIYMS